MKDKEFNYFTSKPKPLMTPKLKRMIRESVKRDIESMKAVRKGAK